MNILIYNNQAAGDCFVGTHLARIIKRDIPDCHITFVISATQTMLTMSTNNPDQGRQEILDIIKLQEDIDATGIASPNNQIQLYSGDPPGVIDKTYQQSEWWGDLGIVGSMLVPYMREKKSDFTKEDLDTETKFKVDTDRILSGDTIQVATAGPLDWNNKFKDDDKRKVILQGLDLPANNIEIIELGADIGNRTYLESLRILNNCHIYVGPEGSMYHLAVGLGLDTIGVCSIYPPEWLNASFYKKEGWHRYVQARAADHCGTYKCIQDKNYDPKASPGWGNPPCQFSSWPQKCPYMASGWSCVNKTNPDDIILEFKRWISDKGF